MLAAFSRFFIRLDTDPGFSFLSLLVSTSGEVQLMLAENLFALSQRTNPNPGQNFPFVQRALQHLQRFVRLYFISGVLSTVISKMSLSL